MTRLEAAFQRSDSRSGTDMHSRRGSASTSRRGSVSQHTDTSRKPEKNGSRGIFERAHRFLSKDREEVDGSPVRHYERGHPLPANHSPERKATIPYRNRDLGLPSYRRRSDNLSGVAISGLSPQRHMSYSNFRRGDSLSPRSWSPKSTHVSPNRRTESRSSSHVNRPRMSHTSSQHVSGNCTPSQRRNSVVTRTTSRSSSTNKYVESSSPSHRRSPSQSTYGHSLDSEKLYKNLKSIVSSAESDNSDERNGWSKRHNSDVDVDNDYRQRRSSRNSERCSRKSGRNTGCNSRDSSPSGRHNYKPQNSGGNSSRNSVSKNGYNSHGTSSPYQEYDNHVTPKNRGRRNGEHSESSEKHSRTDSCQSHMPPNSNSHGSTPKSSSSRQSKSKAAPAVESYASQAAMTETDKPVNDRSRSNIRRGLEALILSENTTSSQPALPEMTMDDYMVIADIPRSKLYPEEEETMVVRRRPQSQSPRRDNQHSYGDEGHRYENGTSDERRRGRERERGRDRREKERKRQDREMEEMTADSTASGHSQRSSTGGDSRKLKGKRAEQPPLMKTDFLTRGKGWMSLLDEDEEWRKFWFVITGSSLKYFRNSEADERDEADGEIFLSHCLRVEEFDADKDFGLQLHMPGGCVTLSAMTSRIRRNWMEVLRRRILVRNSKNPQTNITDRENFASHNAPHRASFTPQPEPGSVVSGQQWDEPDAASSHLTDRREAGEGWDREQERRLEDRSKWFQDGISDREGEDPWEKVELKKATLTPEVSVSHTAPDIEKKWEDLELLSFGETETSLVNQQNPQATNQQLQQEVEALRQARGGGLCGPGSPCALRLEQMERQHKEKLQEMREEHQRKEAEKRLGASSTSQRQKGEEVTEIRRHQHGHDEAHYSQTSDLERRQKGGENVDIKQKEREMEELRRENQELQARLTEEISLMRSFITGQRSEDLPLGNHITSSSEVEMLLRQKETELQDLQREMIHLKRHVQTLTEENEALNQRYVEVIAELSEFKSRSERDISVLQQHLNLSSPAAEERT